MTYSGIEAAIEALVLAYSAGAVFTTALRNVDRGDYRAMDAVGTSVACVLVQAENSTYDYAMPRGHGMHGHRFARHVAALDLFVKRGQALGGDGTAYAALLTLRDGLIDWLERYPRLNGTAGVSAARTLAATRPILLQDRPHAYSRVTMEVIEMYALNWTEQPG